MEVVTEDNSVLQGGTLQRRTQRMLIVAFILQSLIIAACILCMLFIYRDFKSKTQQSVLANRNLLAQLDLETSQLKGAQADLTSAQHQVVIASTNSVLAALTAKDYPSAYTYAQDGLKVAPTDPLLNLRLVQVLILQGKKADALKSASSLKTSPDSETDNFSANQNLVTLGIAKCVNGDASGAIRDFQKSSQLRLNKNEISTFCPSAVAALNFSGA